MTKFPREFYYVMWLATIDFIAVSMISPFFSLYLNEKGASSIELGLIISLMSYTTLAARMPLGLITSRVGIWWVVPIALIGQSSTYILYSVTNSLAHFYIIRIFHAVVLASLQPTLMSLVSTISPEGRKGEAVGIYLTSAGLATVGGPLLCSLLLSYFDYKTILLLSSIIPLTAFIVYLGLLRTATLGKYLSKATGHETLIENPWNNLIGIVTLRPVQALTYVRFTFAFTTSIITTLYAVYVVNTLRLDPSVYALFITLQGLANTLARVPTGRISDAIGRKKPLLISFTLLTAVFLLFSGFENLPIICFTMFLYGVAHGIRAVSEWSLLVDAVPRGSISLANFYFSSVFDLGEAFGATFAGLAAMMMSTPMILRVGAGLMGSSILVVAFTKFPKKG